jgi:hypothetical protein
MEKLECCSHGRNLSSVLFFCFTTTEIEAIVPHVTVVTALTFRLQRRHHFKKMSLYYSSLIKRKKKRSFQKSNMSVMNLFENEMCH